MENDEEAEEQVFEEEELEALEEVQDEEGKRRRGQRKEKKQRRKNNKKARKNKRQDERRTHSHIHIPAGQDKSEDIDIVKEFHKMSEVDEAKIMLLLQPIAFIRCVMTDFNEACGMYIDETTRQALGEL